MINKTDFKKTLDAYRAQRGQFRIVDVPDMQYLMTDGHGDPNTSPAFIKAVEALYPVAYKLKFASKRDLGRDYVVPPLEGLWWAEDLRLAQLHHEFIPGHGLRMAGTHHEIYLSDFRKVAPDKRHTILRQPITIDA